MPAAALPGHLQDIRNTPRVVTQGTALLTSIHAMNTSATLVWLQCFDAVLGGVILGTTIPFLSIPVLAASGHEIIYFGTVGLRIDQQLIVAATTTIQGSSDPGTGVYAQFFLR